MVGGGACATLRSKGQGRETLAPAGGPAGHHKDKTPEGKTPMSQVALRWEADGFAAEGTEAIRPRGPVPAEKRTGGAGKVRGQVARNDGAAGASWICEDKRARTGGFRDRQAAGKLVRS